MKKIIFLLSLFILLDIKNIYAMYPFPTAMCNDYNLSYSENTEGECSYHKGILMPQNNPEYNYTPKCGKAKYIEFLNKNGFYLANTRYAQSQSQYLKDFIEIENKPIAMEFIIGQQKKFETETNNTAKVEFKNLVTLYLSAKRECEQYQEVVSSVSNNNISQYDLTTEKNIEGGYIYKEKELHCFMGFVEDFINMKCVKLEDKPKEISILKSEKAIQGNVKDEKEDVNIIEKNSLPVSGLTSDNINATSDIVFEAKHLDNAERKQGFLKNIFNWFKNLFKY